MAYRRYDPVYGYLSDEIGRAFRLWRQGHYSDRTFCGLLPFPEFRVIGIPHMLFIVGATRAVERRNIGAFDMNAGDGGSGKEAFSARPGYSGAASRDPVTGASDDRGKVPYRSRAAEGSDYLLDFQPAKAFARVVDASEAIYLQVDETRAEIRQIRKFGIGFPAGG